MAEAIQPLDAASARAERWVVVSAIIASAMAFIDSTALNVALPAIQSDLNASGSELLWVYNAYLLFLAAFILLGGSLGDRFGRRRIFMAGIGFFAFASLLCGLAPTTGFLIASRALQGLGGALMVPGSLSMITATVGEGRRGRAIGTWSSLSTITTILGPVLGGYLASVGLWRMVFFINLPLAIIAISALIGRVPESRRSNPEPIDLVGAGFVTLGLAGITYGSIQAAEVGLREVTSAGALAAGGLAIVGFIWNETRVDYPMMPFSLFRSRTFSGTNLLTLFLYAALNGSLFFFSLNLIQIQGYPASLAGLATLPIVIALTLLSRWSGGLADRIGPRILLVIGAAITGLGFFLLALPEVTNGPSEYWIRYFPGLAAIGLGMAVVVAPLTAAVMGAAPADRAGVASGINNAVARVAGVLAIAIMGGIALSVFRSGVVSGAEELELPAAAIADLESEARRLGDAEAPQTLEDQAPAVEQVLRSAFVRTFRTITIACAALAWISALFAAVLVEGRKAGPAWEGTASWSA